MDINAYSGLGAEPCVLGFAPVVQAAQLSTWHACWFTATVNQCNSELLLRDDFPGVTDRNSSLRQYTKRFRLVAAF